ncbi:hypothetical protein GCM10027418_06330 [Mariniluteicoccus endophyticus]
MTAPTRWTKLGKALESRRVEMGFPNRESWVRDVLKRSNSRTHSDIENGRRTNYTPTTLSMLEHHYQLRDGAIADFLASDDDELKVRPLSPPSTPMFRPQPADDSNYVDEDGWLSVQYRDTDTGRGPYWAGALSDRRPDGSSLAVEVRVWPGDGYALRAVDVATVVTAAMKESAGYTYRVDQSGYALAARGGMPTPGGAPDDPPYADPEGPETGA